MRVRLSSLREVHLSIDPNILAIVQIIWRNGQARATGHTFITERYEKLEVI